MTQRITAWWDHLSANERIHHHATWLCVALFLFHYAWYSAWFVEDAAITFAYARNAALGDGFVTYVGGERVEGFSNPSWTLVLAGLRVVGIGPWVASKLLGAVCGAAAVVLSAQWGRRILPVGRWSALVPLLLAVSPQHANWCASGLENAFFNLFLAAGCVALMREVTDGGRPWSALWFAALAITRPEAPMYVAVAGLTGWAFAFRMGFRRAMTWALSWGVLLLVPLVLWHGWRFAYFAWEFPNTYYAKLGESEKFLPFEWDRRGWDYLRNWFLTHARGFVLPLFFIGVTGLRGSRGIAGVVLSAITVALALLGTEWFAWVVQQTMGLEDAWDEPLLLVQVRVVWLAAMVLFIPAIAVDREDDLPRVLPWLLGCTVLFFALYSGGDWMRGWRWLSMGIVPISVLLASGLYAVATHWPNNRVRIGITATLLAVLLVPDAINAGFLVGHPVTTPYDVHRRVQYMQGIQDRLNLDHATVMDVDMGAHLWWFGPEIVDMAGLVDVPIGQHHYDLDFIDEYVYDTRVPTFAHVHASWATRTKMRRHDGWDEYIEVPAYAVSPFSQHEGNHVRRTAFIDETPREGGVARFGRSAVLQDLDVPVPAAVPGGELYVELSWRRVARSEPFRAVFFLASQDAVYTIELPPLYDWSPFARLRKTEKAWGRHRVPVPDDLPLGTYDVGLYVFSEDGEVWSGSGIARDATTADPRVMDGEVRWTGRVTLTDNDTAVARYDAAIVRMQERITGGRCADAERSWVHGRRALSNDHPHRYDADSDARSDLAACYATTAETLPIAQAVEALQRARQWDPRHRTLHRIGAALAASWAPQAASLDDAGDREAAIVAYRQVMAADPTRSWDRRRLEQLRGERIAEANEEE